MRYADMRGHLADTTKKGTLRKRAAQALSKVTQPPATVHTPTGQRGDFQGNVYALHTQKPAGQRDMRRAKATGMIQHMRSRIQRQTRRRRTGGVK